MEIDLGPEPKPFDDDSKMYFGVHKDKRLSEVPAQYFIWLYDRPFMKQPEHTLLRKYIDKNYDLFEEIAIEEQYNREADADYDGYFGLERDEY